MEHSFLIHESIGVSDFFEVKTEIDAIIYRQEFEKYRKVYQDTKSEHDLIFCFIFLQIYVECFLHQNMRKIIELEFKPPRENVLTVWEKAEQRKISEKLDNFITHFFLSIHPEVQVLGALIKDNFKRISYIRNQFAHGHKLSSWSDSDGKKGNTKARSLLTESQLTQSVNEVNELGSAWNDLLNKILPQCKALRGVDDFKFSKMQCLRG